MINAEEKNSTALKTIGEISFILDVPTHILRFWESKFKELAPQKRRGIRYYSNEDIELINYIKSLLYKEKYTIEGVQEVLKKYKKNKIISLQNISQKNLDKKNDNINYVSFREIQNIYENLVKLRERLKNFINK